jgi:hypothetical protein
MRNPVLPMRYMVALLETPSEELNMTRKEHAEILCAQRSIHLLSGIVGLLEGMGGLAEVREIPPSKNSDKCG